MYDENDNLIRKANSSGKLYGYAYNDNGNLTEEILYNYTSNYIDDSGRLAYPITEENHDSLVEKTPQLATIYTVNSLGLITKITTQSYDANAAVESAKITSAYNYDIVTGSAFYGALKNEIDQLGNTTYYFYDITSTGMVSATVDATSGNGTAVYTDIWGKVEEVLPVINGSSTGYTAETNAESVLYNYNVKNQLSEIYTESTTYRFTYDSYGNRISTQAGNNTLASYEYNSNNGKLKKITYSNGFVVEYVYNEVDNVSEICYTVNGTRSVVYKYHYTESGLLHRVDDVRSGKSTVYNYDSQERLRLVTEYNTEDMSNDFSVYTSYNQNSLVQQYGYALTYKRGSSYYDKNISHNFIYDDLDRLSLELLRESDVSLSSTHYTYDDLQRISNVTVTGNGSTFILSTDYTFTENGSQTSTQVKTYKTTLNETAVTYTYTYDSRGNITDISINGTSQYSYAYDNLGQLIREDNRPNWQTYVYEYDNSGNICSVIIYEYAEREYSPEEYIDAKSYTYSSSAWGDLLTAYNGTSVIYDAIANPTSYLGKTFGWEGRKLVSATVGSKNMTFTYNDEGIRTSKTVNGVTTNYYLDGSRIVAEETNGNVTVYLYNAAGLIGFQYHASTYGANTWDTYFYEKNLQGDIVAIYNSAGTKLLSYTYDAWGNFEMYNVNAADAIARTNRFTYRGYYYDKDLELYYLNSRYYDSQTGRFINADSLIAGANGGLQGYNLFAYCFNNPIAFVDVNGNWPSWDDVKKFFEELGETVENVAEAFIDSLEADVGVGFGLGANISDNITIEASRDTYVGFDDGEVVTGNIIIAEVSFFDKSIVGETYNHIVEIGGKRVSKASPYDGPFDMVNYPDVKKGNYITFGSFSLNDEMDFVISLSASLHVLFGGHVSAGFNVTEYFERILD